MILMPSCLLQIGLMVLDLVIAVVFAREILEGDIMKWPIVALVIAVGVIVGVLAATGYIGDRLSGAIQDTDAGVEAARQGLDDRLGNVQAIKERTEVRIQHERQIITEVVNNLGDDDVASSLNNELAMFSEGTNH